MTWFIRLFDYQFHFKEDILKYYLGKKHEKNPK